MSYMFHIKNIWRKVSIIPHYIINIIFLQQKMYLLADEDPKGQTYLWD